MKPFYELPLTPAIKHARYLTFQINSGFQTFPSFPVIALLKNKAVYHCIFVDRNTQERKV